jgi:hypothetical protein
MKKFLVLSVLAAMFASCSVDNESVNLQEETVGVSVIDENNDLFGKIAYTSSCFQSIGGSVFVDVSGGISNPKVAFVADVPNDMATPSANYNVSVEMQLLTDCEDLNTGTGAIIKYTINNVAIPAVNDPRVLLSPSQLPSSCYKWRMAVDGIKVTSSGSSACITYSPWDYEPVF